MNNLTSLLVLLLVLQVYSTNKKTQHYTTKGLGSYWNPQTQHNSNFGCGSNHGNHDQPKKSLPSLPAFPGQPNFPFNPYFPSQPMFSSKNPCPCSSTPSSTSPKHQAIDKDFKLKISSVIAETKELNTPQGIQLTRDLTNTLFAILNILNKKQQLKQYISESSRIDASIKTQVKRLMATIQKIQKYINANIDPAIKGSTNSVSGQSNRIIGKDNSIDGKSNSAFGNNNFIAGNEGIMKGDKNLVIGDDTFIIGKNLTVKGNNTYVFGFDKQVQKSDTLVIGDHTLNLKDYR